MHSTGMFGVPLKMFCSPDAALRLCAITVANQRHWGIAAPHMSTCVAAVAVQQLHVQPGIHTHRQDCAHAQAGLQDLLATYSYKAASISDVLLLLGNHLSHDANMTVRALLHHT